MIFRFHLDFDNEKRDFPVFFFTDFLHVFGHDTFKEKTSYMSRAMPRVNYFLHFIKI